VAVSGKEISGLATKTGDVLWAHELGEEDKATSANPTFIGDDRFLVKMEPLSARPDNTPFGCGNPSCRTLNGAG